MATVDYHTGATFSSVVSAVFKEWYKDGAPPDLTMQDHPSYGLLPKDLWTGGNPYIYAVKVANMTGRSKTFADAKTNDRPAEIKKFQIETVRDYARATFDNETIKRLKTDPQGFLNYMREQTDGAFQQMGDVLAHEMFRDGKAKVAVVASATVSTNTVFVLNDKAEIKAFGLGDVVEFYDDSGTAVKQSGSLANARIIAIDHDAGSFTLTGDYTDAGNFNFTLEAGVDSVAFGGDLSVSGGALEITGLAGLEGWNPETAPTSGDSWFSVDRSAAPNYLAGGREDFSTGTGIREALMTWCAKAHRYRGKWDVIVVNPENFNELEKELTSVSYLDIRITDASAPVQVGYRAIEMACAWGTVAVVSDADCPLNVARGVTFSALKFLTVGRVGPYVIDDDGVSMLRLADEDSFEMRIGYYGQMCCYNPKLLSRCKLPAVSA
jgi:hypothetical protein